MKFHGFDWDAGNIKKAQKHGLTISEIEGLFSREVRVVEDPRHSEEEQRYIAVGRARNSRAMFVAFTLRGKRGATLIRVISARYAHRREARNYEDFQETK